MRCGTVTEAAQLPPEDRATHLAQALALWRGPALAELGYEPLLVLGGGSNLVVADAGFEGTVVKVETRGIVVDSVDQCGGANVTVAAGEEWDGFVAHAVGEGWAGIEALSGIPGSCGATPVQNIGAYGVELRERFESLVGRDEPGKVALMRQGYEG